MPCYNSRSQETVIYQDRDNPQTEIELNRLRIYYDGVTAALCAVLNELDERGIANDVIAKSSRHGLIDIGTWWKNHKKDDESKLAAKLHDYSVDEQKILFKLLSQQLKGDK